jgi:hypothetical protein
VRCTFKKKGFTFYKGETFKPPVPAAAPRNVCRRFPIQRFLKGAAHRNISKMDIMVRCTFCSGWCIFSTNINGALHLQEKRFHLL